MSKSKNGKSGVTFSKDQLDKALYDFEDLMERCLCPFILLGKTARNIVDGKWLGGDKIEVGVERKYLTREALSTLKTFLKKKNLLKGFTYKAGEVPVKVKVINRKYKFFKNKQSKFYMGGMFLVANPFEPYWKSRNIVR
jgi:hypothetical protein